MKCILLVENNYILWYSVLENTINIKHIVEGFDKDSFLNTFIDNMLISGLNDIQSVHAEIILMNQIRDADDILATPDWDSPNPKYQLLMLKKASAIKNTVLKV